LDGEARVIELARPADPLRRGDPRSAEQQRQHASATDPGPENIPIREVSPNTFLPPITDHREVPTFWNTFSSSHRRVQEGGWSRQITVEDFPLSKRHRRREPAAYGRRHSLLTASARVTPA